MGSQKPGRSNFGRQFGRSEFSIIRIKSGVVYPFRTTATGAEENIQGFGHGFNECETKKQREAEGNGGFHVKLSERD